MLEDKNEVSKKQQPSAPIGRDAPMLTSSAAGKQESASKSKLSLRKRKRKGKGIEHLQKKQRLQASIAAVDANSSRFFNKGSSHSITNSEVKGKDRNICLKFREAEGTPIPSFSVALGEASPTNVNENCNNLMDNEQVLEVIQGNSSVLLTKGHDETGVVACANRSKCEKHDRKGDYLNDALDVDHDSPMPSPMFRRPKNILEDHNCSVNIATSSVIEARRPCLQDDAYNTEAKLSRDPPGTENLPHEICVIEINDSASESDKADSSEHKKELKQGITLQNPQNTEGKEKEEAQGKISLLKRSPDESNFKVSRAKVLADCERQLDFEHSDLLETSSKKSTLVERRKKRPRNGICALCSTCSCTRGAALKGLEEGAKNEANCPLSGFARSDAEIERALLGRLKRLEKSSAWFDHLCHRVTRELRKHRTKILSKKDLSFRDADRPRFLDDVDVGENEIKKFGYSRIEGLQVRKAQGAVFAFQKSESIC